METLEFKYSESAAPERMKEFWDVYTIYHAETVYKEAIYKAWGTDQEEAKQKCIDLIVLDKRNGVVREPGQVVE